MSSANFTSLFLFIVALVIKLNCSGPNRDSISHSLISIWRRSPGHFQILFEFSSSALLSLNLCTLPPLLLCTCPLNRGRMGINFCSCQPGIISLFEGGGGLIVLTLCWWSSLCIVLRLVTVMAVLVLMALRQRWALFFLPSRIWKWWLLLNVSFVCFQSVHIISPHCVWLGCTFWLVFSGHSFCSSCMLFPYQFAVVFCSVFSFLGCAVIFTASLFIFLYVKVC